MLKARLQTKLSALLTAWILTNLMPGAAAFGSQRLVNPGDDWQSLGPKLRPGDEIILMPGLHKPATFDNLIGERERPIIIRGADPARPSTIDGLRDGIRIKRAAHLVIKDLRITSATISGISLNGAVAPTASAGNVTEPRDGDIQIRNVEISRIGPKGQRHGIVLTNLEDVRIQQCRFAAWGGSAIEIVACRDVSIDQCKATGAEDHTQLQGIRARAGTSDLRVSGCRLEDVSETAICLGGSSEPDEFAVAPAPDAATGSVAEVSHTSIEGCQIIGSRCAVALIHADDCVIRRNTIVRPRGFVLAWITEHKQTNFTIGQRNIFGANLITWEPGDLQKLAEVGEKIDTSSFVLEENLWWSLETDQQRARLGTLPGKDQQPQTTRLDPKLDANFKPTAPAAQRFGAER